jgi:hypothetical protein
MGILPLLVRGVRVYVEPQFQVEFIDVEPQGGVASYEGSSVKR